MNKYKLPNGRNFKIINAQILVERIALPGTDERGMRTTKSGIILPNPEREDPTAIGIIRAVGHLWKPGPKDENGERGEPFKVPLDCEPGMKCCFLWFYAETHTNQMISKLLGDKFILLKWEDIGFVWPGNEDHEVSDIRSMGR